MRRAVYKLLILLPSEEVSILIEASQVTLVVKKNLPTNAGDVGSLEEGMTTAPVFLAGDPHKGAWLAGYSP